MVAHDIHGRRRGPGAAPSAGRRALAPLVPTLALLAPAGAPAEAGAPVEAVVVEAAVGVEPVAILEALAVSAAQKATQQTPIAVRDGVVYLAHLEPGLEGDADGIGLHTVVRRGAPADPEAPGGPWSWDSATVDVRSAFDPWHAPPAVGVDREGRVHVAYNMHNMPWQYGVFAAPDSIADFRFRGQRITLADRERVKFENRTDFPTLGSAAIPGNQVTYPAFFNDRAGELYVTYRFAARPARAFEERAMSAGIARHDAAEDAWIALGATVALGPDDARRPWYRLLSHRAPIALASADGWTAYHPRPTFGPDGELHVTWAWREGVAGDTVTRPCHLVLDGAAARTADGADVELPARPEDCGNLGVPDAREHYTVGNAASDAAGVPHVVLSPVEGLRELHRLVDGRWESEPLPHSASEIFFDAADNLWAVASGPRLFARRPGETEWALAYEHPEREHCGARVALDRPANVAYLHAPHCEGHAVSVLRVDLAPFSGAASEP